MYLPSSVAEMLVEHKKEQENVKEALGPEYKDHDLIKKHGLPKVVFHSLRHSSITYKLKLNGGDVKAVQGDSGHAQSSMVTDVYSHILDEGRIKNAQLFENAFYSKKKPKAEEAEESKKEAGQPEDLTKLIKLLSNPETAALLRALLGAAEK